MTQALSMTHLSASGGRPNQRDFIFLTFRGSLDLVDHLHFERLVFKGFVRTSCTMLNLYLQWLCLQDSLQYPDE